ncbi:flagellar hook-length control protein FliK [Chromatiaceae bacterium AAb-1]|nr:flagellar hook-length control protein FliK [Chromatiaceae bacterium AAb-1]
MSSVSVLPVSLPKNAGSSSGNVSANRLLSEENHPQDPGQQDMSSLPEFAAELMSSVLAEPAEVMVSSGILPQENTTEEQPVSIALWPDMLSFTDGEPEETDAEQVVTPVPQSQILPAVLLTAGNTVAETAGKVASAGQVQAAPVSSAVAQRWQTDTMTVLPAVSEQPANITSAAQQNTASQQPSLSLQQFLQHWQGALPTAVPVSSENNAFAAQQGQSQPAAESIFQWKADSLGQQSSAWGQKLLHLLSDKVHLQLGQQIQRAQIRLDPPHLGAIELNVAIDGEKTTVQLYASNQQVREAMQQNIDQLRQSLGQRMGQEMAVEVSVRQHAEQQQNKPAFQTDEIDKQYEVAAVPTATPAAGKPQSGWLNRLV